MPQAPATEVSQTEGTPVAAEEAPAAIPENGTAKSAKAATSRKTVKKAATKKAAPKAEKKAPKEKNQGPNKTQVRVLQTLGRNSKPLTRSQLSEKLDGAFVGSDMMGHLDKAKIKPTSLVARGLVKIVAPEEEGGATHYELTAKGRDFIAKK